MWMQPTLLGSFDSEFSTDSFSFFNVFGGDFAGDFFAVDGEESPAAEDSVVDDRFSNFPRLSLTAADDDGGWSAIGFFAFAPGNVPSW